MLFNRLFSFSILLSSEKKRNFMPKIDNHVSMKTEEWSKIFFCLSCTSDHIQRSRSRAGFYDLIVLHFPQLKPQRGLRLHSHWDSLPHGRLCQVLSREGLACPLHPEGQEQVQLHIQLKAQHVPPLPALWNVPVFKETAEQPKTPTGMLYYNLDTKQRFF